jgi:hypothetical protein
LRRGIRHTANNLVAPLRSFVRAKFILRLCHCRHPFNELQ